MVESNFDKYLKEFEKKLINEGINVYTDKEAETATTQAKWDKECKCQYCGNKAYLSLTVMDEVNDKDKKMIPIYNKDGSKRGADIQSIALYYCPKCFKFTALNNMA